MLYFFYFTQLYAEATTSGHGPILIPSVLFLLCCSPSLDREVQSRSEWPLQLIRIYLASGYFSSGMCKLLCGARFGRFWGKGTTLQMYIFDSMWSRPAGSRIYAAQCWLLRRPRLATILACGSIAFETGFLLAPFSDELGVIFGLNGFLFHIGIYLLQVPAAPPPRPTLHLRTLRAPSAPRVAPSSAPSSAPSARLHRQHPLRVGGSWRELRPAATPTPPHQTRP